MRKLFSNGLAVFAGVVSLPVPGTQADSAKPATAEHRNEPAKDSRLAFLRAFRSEEHTSELQSLRHIVCRLLLVNKMMVTVLSFPIATVKAPIFSPLLFMYS